MQRNDRAQPSYMSNPKIDVAFEQDARWKGVHPSYLHGESAQALDQRMPNGFRYARELQSELCFVLPLTYDRKSPDGTFILQKPGSKAVPIISPTKKIKTGQEKMHIMSTMDHLKNRSTFSHQVQDAGFTKESAKLSPVFECDEQTSSYEDGRALAVAANGVFAASTQDTAQPHLTPPPDKITGDLPRTSSYDQTHASANQSYFSDSASRFASLGSSLKVYGPPHLTKAYEFSSTIMAGQH